MPEAGRSPPLDLLLYAHDGRGLGHVSRSVAVGLAVRRLHPGLRTLLVSGARGCAELIGPAPLDWVKLPAYATQVVDGRSRGIDGPSGLKPSIPFAWESSYIGVDMARRWMSRAETSLPRV